MILLTLPLRVGRWPAIDLRASRAHGTPRSRPWHRRPRAPLHARTAGCPARDRSAVDGSRIGVPERHIAGPRIGGHGWSNRCYRHRRASGVVGVEEVPSPRIQRGRPRARSRTTTERCRPCLLHLISFQSWSCHDGHPRARLTMPHARPVACPAGAVTTTSHVAGSTAVAGDARRAPSRPRPGNPGGLRRPSSPSPPGPPLAFGLLYRTRDCSRIDLAHRCLARSLRVPPVEGAVTPIPSPRSRAVNGLRQFTGTVSGAADGSGVVAHAATRVSPSHRLDRRQWDVYGA